MPPTNRSEAEIHGAVARAEQDLERKIAMLKDVVHAKLETPEHVVAAIRRPLAFAGSHARAIAIAAAAVVVGAIGLGVLHHLRNRHA